MKNFEAQKLAEQLLINSIMYKNVTYEITESTLANTYIVHNLKADIENGSVLFSDERISFIIEDTQKITITDTSINILFKDNSYINIKLIK